MQQSKKKKKNRNTVNFFGSVWYSSNISNHKLNFFFPTCTENQQSIQTHSFFKSLLFNIAIHWGPIVISIWYFSVDRYLGKRFTCLKILKSLFILLHLILTIKRLFPPIIRSPVHVITHFDTMCLRCFQLGNQEPFRLHNRLPANQRICCSVPFPARPITFAESQSPRPRNDEKTTKKAVVSYYQLACLGRTIYLF